MKNAVGLPEISVTREATVTWNYTTWLNIGFLLLAAFLVWRFVTTGGIDMLRMMNRPARGDEAHHHAH